MGINVLSLFDGISTCYYVLKNLGFNIDNYYASEIDTNAISISKYNFSDNIIQLGDITKITYFNGILTSDNGSYNIDRIDLLTFGSPCIDLSAIKTKGKRTGLKGAGSSLYYEALRLLRDIKPKYFLMENVVMENIWKDEITKDLGVEPIFIDSAIITGANRPRLYWTNIPRKRELVATNTKLKDYLQPAYDVNPKDWYDYGTFDYISDTANVQCIMHFNTHEMNKRVYNANGLCGTLTAVNGGYNEKKVYQDGRCRKLTPIEYERLQGLPDNYTEKGIDEKGKIKIIADGKRRTACGNGWTVGVIENLLEGMVF